MFSGVPLRNVKNHAVSPRNLVVNLKWPERIMFSGRGRANALNLSFCKCSAECDKKGKTIMNIRRHLF